MQLFHNDWKLFNSFNWHSNTDVRIAQFIYQTNINLLGSSTTVIQQHEFIQACINHPSGAMKTASVHLVFNQHTSGENLPDTLAKINSYAKVYEDVFSTINF